MVENQKFKRASSDAGLMERSEDSVCLLTIKIFLPMLVTEPTAITV
jgi:hypothetical protein